MLLCKLMYKHFGKKVILLIDEYDTPLVEAYAADLWDNAVSFMRELFNVSLKSHSYLEKVLLTGITRVSKESLFSDMNHLYVASVTSPHYATAFGFTAEEVTAALIEQGMEGEQNGYRVAITNLETVFAIRGIIRQWFTGRGAYYNQFG